MCFSYIARAEMVTAAQTLSAGVQEGLINVEYFSAIPSPRFFLLDDADMTVRRDINGDLLEECMYTSGCPPLDILIRTSGEKRLSDFLLWQVRIRARSFLFGLGHW